MAWRLAKSLVTLRDQVNAAYPDRDKTSDGGIGDTAHQGTNSDHNPNAQDVVCAYDLDHDPDNGFDGDKFLAAQLKNPHPNLKYIVWEGHIYSRKYAWKKRPSSGHYAHLHVSVGIGSDGKSAPGTYDDTTRWDIGLTENKGVTVATKEEIDHIAILATGSKPGAGFNYAYWITRPLYEVLHALSGVDAKGGTLYGKVVSGELVPSTSVGDCTAQVKAERERLRKAVTAIFG